LRIFTPATELPCRSSDGRAAVLLAIVDGAKAAREFVLEEKVGNVPCRFEAGNGGERLRCVFMIPRLPCDRGDLPASQDRSRAVASARRCRFRRHRARVLVGRQSFSFVPLKNLDAIGRSRPDPASFEMAFGIDGPGMVFPFCKETVGGGQRLSRRMFAPGRVCRKICDRLGGRGFCRPACCVGPNTARAITRCASSKAMR